MPLDSTTTLAAFLGAIGLASIHLFSNALRILEGVPRSRLLSIAAVRRRHLQALAGLFQQVLRLCRTAGLVTLGHVALDGTKLNAHASTHTAMSDGRRQTREPELEPAIQAEVQKMLDQAEAEDAADDRRLGEEVRGDERPAHLRTTPQRLAAIRTAKAELEVEAREQAQAAGTDPNTATVPDTAPRHCTDPESRIQKARAEWALVCTVHNVLKWLGSGRWAPV